MHFIVNNYCTIIINVAVNRFLTISLLRCIHFAFFSIANFLVLSFLLVSSSYFPCYFIVIFVCWVDFNPVWFSGLYKDKKHIVKYEMILVIVTLRSTSNQNHCNLSFYFDLYCEMGQYIFGDFKVYSCHVLLNLVE